MSIKINAEEMLSKAGMIRGYKEDHNVAIQSIRSTITALCNTDSFDGQAASAYLAKFESMSSNFTQFEALLESLATSLESTANTMTETDNSLASALSSVN